MVIVECSNCPENKQTECFQYLDESVGWQWWTRKDDSWERCHKNHLIKKDIEEKLRGLE